MKNSSNSQRKYRPTKSHALGVRDSRIGALSHAHTHSNLFLTHWGQTGKKIKTNDNALPNRARVYKNAIYNVCTFFRLHAVYQNHQLELPYKQSANLQIAHAFALPAGSA